MMDGTPIRPSAGPGSFNDAQIAVGMKQMLKVLEDGSYSFNAAFTSAIEAMGGTITDSPAAETKPANPSGDILALIEAALALPAELQDLIREQGRDEGFIEGIEAAACWLDALAERGASVDHRVAARRIRRFERLAYDDPRTPASQPPRSA